MCSSGIRVGSWDYLRWKDIEPKYDEKGELVAAKLTVYGGTPDQYFSFCSPEAFLAIKDWMDFRKLYGEPITGDSYVYRNLFRISDIKRDEDFAYNKRLKGIAQQGRTTEPIKLKKKTIERLLSRAYYEQGLRNGLEEGANRSEWKTAHFTRKWFKTKAEQVMNRLNIEVLLGHRVGLNSNYYRPTESELLQDYLRAVPHLVINEAKDVTELKREQEESNKEIEELRREQREMRELLNTAIKQMTDSLATRLQNLSPVEAEQKKEKEDIETELKDIRRRTTIEKA
jgi:hypothetical protein